ncbi:hypothetical protein [Blastococcus sp. CCUG 61487]|uniref:hypothetical protein n=1 Tax=Blastococcus sp. CCUG 61487 TaxID=1840703 RepID=UPI0010C0DEF2|nr:hypothetical protein [Blastococcus sp. CCUG 61487]TKJ31084.1 hypothetical protein A6V29_18615 [Blastococcus sp. CCUG 61487]
MITDQPADPGSSIIEFVALHHAIHVSHEGSSLSRSQYEDAAQDYEEAMRQVEALCAVDLRLCLSLVADITAQLMQALGEQGREGAVESILSDASGRGWTASIRRSGVIRPTRSPGAVANRGLGDVADVLPAVSAAPL